MKMAPNHGYIQVAPGRRYFQFEDGTPFFPIGHADYRLSRIDEALMCNLRDNAENTLRIWPDALESGQINEEHMTRVVELAEKFGIYLVVSAINASRMSDLFAGTSEFAQGQTLWNSVVAAAEDLLVEREAIELARSRLAFMMDRWGQSPNIFVWELMNQIDALYMATSAMMQTWVDAVAPWVRQYELGTRGKCHLRAVSSYDQLPAAEFFYSSPHLDFIAAHNYPESMYTPLNAIDVARDVNRSIRCALARAATPRPYLDTEAGPISHFFEVGLPQPPAIVLNEWFHNLIWANVASGGAGHTLVFPVNYGQGYHLTAEQGRSQRALARFIQHVDWPMFASVNADDEITVGQADVWGMGCRDETVLVGWLLHDTRVPDTLALVDQALAQGPTHQENRHLRLFAIDAWSHLLHQGDLEPRSMYSREVITLLSIQSRRHADLRQKATSRIDDELAKLTWLAARDGAARRLWETSRTVSPVAPHVQIQGLPAGRYRIRWFDDTTGDLVQVDQGQANGGLTLAAPSFARHIAYIVEPQP